MPNGLTFRIRLIAVMAVMTMPFWPAGHAFTQPEPLGFGSHQLKIEFDGADRTYQAYVPNEATEQAPSPLLIVLHGTWMSGQEMMHTGHFLKHAELNGFVVAAPDSLGDAFNEGSARGGATVDNIDDVGFIEAVADDMQQRINIDPDRVFIAGFSSGASMAQRIALESDYGFAGIAGASGHLWIEGNAVRRPTNLLLIWGEDDPANPKNGGPVEYKRAEVTLQKPSLAATQQKWSKLMGCRDQPPTAEPFAGSTRISLNGCRDGKRFDTYFVHGLGHHWPGGSPVPYPLQVAGPYLAPFDLTDVIWTFFTGEN